MQVPRVGDNFSKIGIGDGPQFKIVSRACKFVDFRNGRLSLCGRSNPQYDVCCCSLEYT